MKKQLFTHLLILFYSLNTLGQIHPTTELLKEHRSNILNNLNYLIKDSLLYSQIQLESKEVILTASEDHFSLNQILYTQIEHSYNFTIQNNKNPFHGLRVAIDPGHTANSFENALIEGKYVSLSSNKDSCKIYEAKLTWLTAVVLKDFLEKNGATIFLTRPKLKLDSQNMTFQSWLLNYAEEDIDSLFKFSHIDKKQHQKLISHLSDTSSINNRKVLFKYYNKIDIENRAKIINEFKPHITIVIHFNVDVNNTGWTTPTNKNYNLAFVPGAFTKNELETKDEINDFNKLLFTPIIERSQILSNAILKHLNKNLKTPSLSDDSKIEYLTLYSLKSPFNGVYSRNLTLTRKINSPLCYGETLYQDNWEICNNLAKEDLDFEGHKINQTIFDIATGYFNGIKEYLEYEFE